MAEPQADFALIGLAVMGQNLVLNMNDHGYTVAVYNRTVSKVDEFLALKPREPKSSAPIPSSNCANCSNGPGV